MENPKRSNQNEISCKQCGGKLTFSAGEEKLKCNSCGTINEIAVDRAAQYDAIQEIDFHAFLRNAGSTAVQTQVMTVNCTGCGASTTFDPNIISDHCEFCGSPLAVKEGHKINMISPKALLPFKVEIGVGRQKFSSWIKGLWFAPSKLKYYANHSDKLSGIYTPYWTFDADTYTRYTGERGDDYQQEYQTTENGKSVTKTRTETRWSRASGDVSRFFNDVLVPASKTLPVHIMKKLRTWDLQNLVPYDLKYMSGFKSETYQLPLEEAYKEAQSIMKDVIEDDVRDDIGGDRQRINSMDTRYKDITFKHILLPMYLSAYKYNDKVYRFMINGRTGEVQGERPYSAIKIALAIIVGLAILGTLYMLSQ